MESTKPKKHFRPWIALSLCVLTLTGLSVGHYMATKHDQTNLEKVKELTQRSEVGLDKPIDFDYPENPNQEFVWYGTNKPAELRWSNACLLTSKVLNEKLGLEKWNTVWVLNADKCVQHSDEPLKDGDYNVFDGRSGVVYTLTMKDKQLVHSNLINASVNEQATVDALLNRTAPEETWNDITLDGTPLFTFDDCLELTDFQKALNTCPVRVILKTNTSVDKVKILEEIQDWLKVGYPNSNVLSVNVVPDTRRVIRKCMNC